MTSDQQFRDLMAGVCAPVSVVTTLDADGPHGATVSSLASLSLQPQLVSIALDRRSGLLPRVVATGAFGVNVLAADQDDVAQRFARRGDRFAAAGWSPHRGLPRLSGVAGWAACRLWSTVDGGDHLLLLGEVTDAVSTAASPLIYSRRTYGTHSGFRPRTRPRIADAIAACAR
ncbi:flavin reductase family protein [Amycolatopsis jejuensis]|uniref:flavin reductase family protein n=1 Tax=Amycolatopsis jejuensis TaxID=330084 RepID=UPI000524C541|nr:flavin reductase family protein [Amycolatopsis jejuensis]